MDVETVVVSAVGVVNRFDLRTVLEEPCLKNRA
jgi:hypothetical protein